MRFFSGFVPILFYDGFITVINLIAVKFNIYSTKREENPFYAMTSKCIPSSNRKTGINNRH